MPLPRFFVRDKCREIHFYEGISVAAIHFYEGISVLAIHFHEGTGVSACGRHGAFRGFQSRLRVLFSRLGIVFFAAVRAAFVFYHYIYTLKTAKIYTLMKKLLFPAIAVAVLSLSTAGCGMSPSKQGEDSLAADSADTAVADTATAAANVPLPTDSVSRHMAKDSTIECNYIVDYPSGSDKLAQGVRKFIAEKLDETYMPRMQTEDGSRNRSEYPAYSGSLAGGRKLVDFYTAGTMRYLQKFREESKDDFGEYEMPPLYQTIKVRKVADEPRYVTYRITDDSYLGGAHGSFCNWNINIAKSTGSPVTYTVDSTRIKALQPLLRKGVLRYVKECGETGATLKTLNNYLLLPDDGLIPLPANTPYIEKDSVCFVYQQYEIACYAMGLVSFNIAVADMQPYLTPAAKALTGK